MTGWASLRLHRASYFDGRGPDAVTRLPVLLLVGSARLRNTPEVVAIRARPAAPDVVTRHGIRCTRPERALLDHIAQVRDLRESVVAIDMAAAAELTSIRRFAAHLDLRDEMDALAERPREWHLRHATGPRWPASGVIRRASGDGRNNRRGPGLVWQMLQS